MTNVHQNIPASAVERFLLNTEANFTKKEIEDLFNKAVLEFENNLKESAKFNENSIGDKREILAIWIANEVKISI